jgi:hypothetical protein
VTAYKRRKKKTKGRRRRREEDEREREPRRDVGQSPCWLQPNINPPAVLALAAAVAPTGWRTVGVEFSAREKRDGNRWKEIT